MSRRFLALAALILLSQSRSARADVTLPALISDGMVLQAGTPVHIWGSAADGERVTVTLHGQSATAQAEHGQWSVSLPPQEPGGPYELTVAGQNTRVLRDVLIGDVWLCSGQSNMEFPLSRSADSAKDIAAPADVQLRSFTVGRQLAATPQTDVSSGTWESATPETRGHFTAVGYYFARALREARPGVPIGLIHSSWGGTPAEAWTSRPALERWGMPAEAFKVLEPPSAAARDAYLRRQKAWEAAGKPQGTFDDPGVLESSRSWPQPATGTKGWSSMQLPQAWERANADLEIDGAVWFRKEVKLPPAWAGRELELHLAAIDDTDTTYFNGTQVGSTGADIPQHWGVQRRYPVPASAVSAGRAVVAVRVWDHGGEGGLMGPAGEMWLAPVGAPEAERISLAGEWRYKTERTRPTLPQPPGLNQNQPSVLYNGMIAPLLPYAVRGATWYQGESNTGRANQYTTLLEGMVRGWRTDWKVGDFPFLIVQLAPFMAIDATPQESGWATLRASQAFIARDLPSTGLAVITDVGDEKDIHPTKKQPVGERLALAARRIAYGEAIEDSGPTFLSADIGGGSVVLHFQHAGKGLVQRGERLTGFAIAGKDEKFVNADARIAGNTVVVSSPEVPAPLYVRFGWANYPVVNLWNEDGLPAVPFRTDPP